MSEEVKKWFDDFINNIVQKIRAGKELNALETQVITNYASNQVLYEYLERRLGELERNLRDEIRKTREELLGNDEKIKQELLANDERIKQELKDEIQRVKTDLENKIKEVDRKVEATRSDLGLVAEEVYVKNFVDYLQSNGERVISVYRHYETSLGEIDAVIETSAKVYAVEVKLRAEVSDVDDILSKAKVLKEELGREVYPVLTGSKINRTVRGYAKGFGVLVI
ncbi:hypothetical protein WIW90_00025 [Sulfolobaceae archaeon RB850M]